LIDIEVIFISLFKYRIGIEIYDITIIIIDGNSVHNVSIFWFSNIDLLIILFLFIITIMIVIISKIIKIIILSFNLFIFIIEDDSLNLYEYIIVFMINNFYNIIEF